MAVAQRSVLAVAIGLAPDALADRRITAAAEGTANYGNAVPSAFGNGAAVPDDNSDATTGTAQTGSAAQPGRAEPDRATVCFGKACRDARPSQPEGTAQMGPMAEWGSIIATPTCAVSADGTQEADEALQE